MSIPHIPEKSMGISAQQSRSAVELGPPPAQAPASGTIMASGGGDLIAVPPRGVPSRGPTIPAPEHERFPRVTSSATSCQGRPDHALPPAAVELASPGLAPAPGADTALEREGSIGTTPDASCQGQPNRDFQAIGDLVAGVSLPCSDCVRHYTWGGECRGWGGSGPRANCFEAPPDRPVAPELTGEVS